MRMELEMFQLKRENPRNHSNLIQHCKIVARAFLRNDLGWHPFRNDDLSDSIIQEFNTKIYLCLDHNCRV